MANLARDDVGRIIAGMMGSVVFNRRAVRTMCALVVTALAALGCGGGQDTTVANPGSETVTSGDGTPIPFTDFRDHIYGLYQRTLKELPPGFTLDDERYGTAQAPAPCRDTPPFDLYNFPDFRDLVGPGETDGPETVAKVADIWRGFGWHVEPRDSEMVARTPDGYTLIIDGTESWMGMFAESPCAIRDESVFVDDAHIITADRIHFGPRE